MKNPPPQAENRVEEVGMEKQEHADGAMSQHPNNPRTYQTFTPNKLVLVQLREPPGSRIQPLDTNTTAPRT